MSVNQTAMEKQLLIWFVLTVFILKKFQSRYFTDLFDSWGLYDLFNFAMSLKKKQIKMSLDEEDIQENFLQLQKQATFIAISQVKEVRTRSQSTFLLFIILVFITLSIFLASINYSLLQGSNIEAVSKQLISNKVWLFRNSTLNFQIGQLIIYNNKHFSQLSNHSIEIITPQNYQQYISQSTVEHLETLFRQLKFNNKTKTQGNQINLVNIMGKMIMMGLLMERGGIVVTQQLILTENLDWIQEVDANPYVNRGDYNNKAKVVGFYTPYYSSSPEKQNRLLDPSNNPEEVDSYMVLFPTIESFLLSASANNEFIVDLFNELFIVLRNPEKVREEIENNEYQMKNLYAVDIQKQFFMLASQRVLQRKQKQLDHQNEGKRKFAIDYYGLALINIYYGPNKIDLIWENNQIDKIYLNLATYSIEELEQHIGPLRYCTFFPKDRFSWLLGETVSMTGYRIMNGSFLQKMLWSRKNQKFIDANNQKPFIKKQAEPWNSLPKTIWIYWDSGLSHSHASNQLCVLSLVRMNAPIGFKIVQTNDSNIQEYLDAKKLNQIRETIKRARVKTYPQTKSDLYRLALVEKYGGVYLDASYITLESFDWLVNIGRYPSQYIFNRYGALPKVLMFFHPHYGSPFGWDIGPSGKVNWHRAYENNFIAAEPKSKFITEWFQLYMQMLKKQASAIEEQFSKCGISGHLWTNKNDHYLLAMDCAKCVVGRQQKALQKTKDNKWADASDYYGIWSMSGYLGQQKLRINTNFDNPFKHDHYYLTRYPQQYVYGLLGKFRHLVKIYNLHSKTVNNFIAFYHSNFSAQTHSQSIFQKYLLPNSYNYTLVNFMPGIADFNLQV